MTGKLGHAWHRCMGVVWHFGWASWAVHGIWGMVSVHDGAHGVVHVPDGGLVNACVYS